jgi:hypothetical protein
MRSPFLAFATLVAALAACSGGGSGNALIPPFDVPAGVVVADFDGDGRDDVALAFAHVAGPPPHAGYVRIFRQSAAGVFDVPVDYAAGADPYGLSAGDFDGDGVLDLVAASPGTAAQPNPADIGISILRQDPAARGRFLSAQWIATAGAAATDATIAQLTSDGLADVAIADGRSANGRALLLAQNPAHPGELVTPVSLLAGSGRGSEDLAAGDVNGDGLTDVVLAAQEVVALFYQQPAGGFAPTVALPAGLARAAWRSPTSTATEARTSWSRTPATHLLEAPEAQASPSCSRALRTALVRKASTSPMERGAWQSAI